MKISRKARNQYNLDDFTFNDQGNIAFGGDVYSIRLFVQKVNQRKNLISFPELAMSVGKFNGVALISDLYYQIIHDLTVLKSSPTLLENLSQDVIEKIGKNKIEKAIQFLVEEFPPESVYKGKIDTEEYLKEELPNEKAKGKLLNEFITLWLQNNNPAFSDYNEFFDDTIIEKNTAYNEIVDEIIDYFSKELVIPSKNQSIIDFLTEPIKKHPYSIKAQLEYIKEHWSDLIGDYDYRILLALDLIREEEMFRGLGPGESLVLEYDLLEAENYTPDKDWMPKVVMIAKNIYVWLDQLSREYKRTFSKLHEIPDEELKKLRNWGFNAIWSIVHWDRSQASKTIKRWCGNPEAEASAYSIFDYGISYDLGGYESFKNLKDRAWSHGIRLASDMVPNHTGIVSKWTIEHPDWFISLPFPPFPSYSYSGENLAGRNDIGIFLEDKYFSRTDAAVTFKRVDFNSSDTKYIYHGNDGTSFPWNDTAQLNFLIPEVREAVIQQIINVSKLFPIIRFDAAMTLTRRHYQRLWFPEPGTGGAIPSRAGHGLPREEFYKAMPNEFWREVVDRISRDNPDTLLLAEAFWLLEGFFVRTLGMHRVYNSAFMNMLRDEDNMKYRAVMKNTLEFDPKILKRFVNFMNNPDEETAIKQFGDGEKYFGICAMLVTMPGLPMFGHGQIEGYHEKYGMEYKKAYWNEEVNIGLMNHHEATIFKIMEKRYLFAEVKNFLLYDFWTGNMVNEDVFAYSNRFEQERGLVIYHNKYAETKGFIKNSVGFAIQTGDQQYIVQKTLAEGLNIPQEGYCIFKDYMTDLEYIRRNKDLIEEGLYIELHAYQVQVYMDFRIVQDNEFFHYAQLYDFLAGKGVKNIDEALNDVIYGPIHRPIEELVNPKTYQNLLDPEHQENALNQVGNSLDRLLNEIKVYTKGKGELEIIKKTILKHLSKTLNWKKNLKNQRIKKDVIKAIENLLPTTKFEWSIIISWELLRNLGKIVSGSHYELRSRSWLDEWRIAKYIQTTLQRLSKVDDRKIFNAILLVKILISHQNWYNHKRDKFVSNNDDFLKVLLDSEVHQYLRFNRYQEVLWFSAESYEILIRWLSIINIIELFDLDDVDLEVLCLEIIEKYSEYLQAGVNSKFKVETLFQILKA